MDPLSLLWLFFILASLQPGVQRQVLLAQRRRALNAISREREATVMTLIHRQEAMSLLGFPIVRYIDIDDAEGVLRAIHDTPAGRAIEIILHTPGGLVIAAQQIASALADHDGRVTAVVPHYAMSGGTLIALAADEIVIDAHAALGPVDPQLGQYPAASLVEVAEAARRPRRPDADHGRRRSQGDRAGGGIHDAPAGAPHAAGARARRGARCWRPASGRTTIRSRRRELTALGLPVRVGVPQPERELMTLYPQPRGRTPAVEYVPGPASPSAPGRPQVPREAGR